MGDQEKCVGVVAAKFRAEPLVDGPPGAYVLAVDQVFIAGAPKRVYFTCSKQVFDVIWEGDEVEWSTRRVVDVRTKSSGSVPDEWNKAHADVHFVERGK